MRSGSNVQVTGLVMEIHPRPCCFHSRPLRVYTSLPVPLPLSLSPSRSPVPSFARRSISSKAGFKLHATSGRSWRPWKRNRKEMPRLDTAANIRGKKYRSTIHHEFQPFHRSSFPVSRPSLGGKRIVARDRVARNIRKRSSFVGCWENLDGGGRSEWPLDRILLIDEY